MHLLSVNVGTRCLALLGCLGFSARALDAAEPEAAPADVRRHALLVGCTKYDHHLDLSLDGPANDVVLMAKTLQGRYGFTPERMRILSEAADGSGRATGAVGRPTRANIAAEFQRLEKTVRSGDQVVILLAGHGSQQPDMDHNLQVDPEPDGLDETFMPCDVQGWKDNTVVGAIIDDELGRWTRAIAARGVLVWVIFDSCHSGTALRGDSPFKQREMKPAALGVPEPIQQQSRSLRADSRSRGDDAGGGAVDGVDDTLPIIALYAAQAFETEKECMLPLDSKQQDWRGLLSYALCQVLEQGPPPSYRELHQCIVAQYRKWGWADPTPLIEGANLDRLVLDEKPRPPRFQLSGNARDGWKLDAGRLHGLSAGSILAVAEARPAGEAAPAHGAASGESIVGYVRVDSNEMADSVVKPCAYGDRAAVADLPAGGLCQLVYRDLGDFRLRVAVDQRSRQQDAELARVAAQLKLRSAQPEALFELWPKLAGAHWAVQFRDGDYWLLPADLATTIGALPTEVTRFRIPTPVDEERLCDALNRAARVHNLLTIAEPLTVDQPAGDAQQEFSVGVEMVKLKDKTDRQGTRLASERPITLHSKDWVAWRISNRGSSAVEVTLLFIDSHLAISPLFPTRNTIGDNRILRNSNVLTMPARVTATTTGREQVVAVAVKAQSWPVDFMFLAQPSLDRALGTRGAGPDSPLVKLLKSANYRAGTSRGLESEELSSYSVRFISWNVED
ncbi:MAG TPA: caspase family protein [Pirellulales bacterium]